MIGDYREKEEILWKQSQWEQMRNTESKNDGATLDHIREVVHWNIQLNVLFLIVNNNY